MNSLTNVQFLITDQRQLILLGPAGVRVVEASEANHVIVALRYVCATKNAPMPTPGVRVKKNYIFTNADYYKALTYVGTDEFTSIDLATYLQSPDGQPVRSSGSSSFLHRAWVRKHVARLEGGTPYRYRLTTAGLDYLTATNSPELPLVTRK